MAVLVVISFLPYPNASNGRKDKPLCTGALKNLIARSIVYNGLDFVQKKVPHR